MATHSSILAWRIPRTEEPVGYSPYGLKEPDTTEATCPHTHTCVEKRVSIYNVLLSGVQQNDSVIHMQIVLSRFYFLFFIKN